MKTYFAGSGVESFSITGLLGNAIREGSVSSMPELVAVYIPYAGEVIGTFSDPDTGASVTLTDFWAAAHLVQSYNNPDPASKTQNFLCFTSASGARLALRFDQGVGLFYLGAGASTWTKIGASVGFVASTLANWRLDLNVKGCGTTSGTVTVYSNGNIFASYSGLDLSGFAGAVDMRAGRAVDANNYDSSGMVYSFLASDYSTLNCSVVRMALKAIGTYADWTGAGISALTSIPPASAGYASTAAGQKLSVKSNGVSVDTATQIIAAVRVGIWGTTTDGGPHGVAPLMKSGSTEVTGAVKSLGLTYGGVLWAVDKDPATGQPWTAAGLTAAEIGVVSADAALEGS